MLKNFQKEEKPKSLSGFSFVKSVLPSKKQSVADYNFLDWDGTLIWQDKSFYLFWDDEIIKQIINDQPNLVLNYVLSKGKFLSISLSKDNRKVYLYNLGSLFEPGAKEEEVKSYFNTQSAKEVFFKIRDLFLELNVDLAKVKSQSSLASTIFRFNFLNEPIYHPPYPVRRLALQCAFGDFRQTYQFGDFKGLFRFYDAKSFYPNCIFKLKELPSGQDWKQVFSEAEFLDEKNKGGFAQISFKNKTCLNICGKKVGGNQLVYKQKGFGVISLAEFRSFKGMVDLYFVRGWVYQKGNLSLYDYESFLMEMREKYSADLIIYLFIKNLQNMIVGKMLQKGRRIAVSSIREMCKKYHLPFSMALKTFFPERRLKTFEQIGALWCPEWYSLITGQGRSIQVQAVFETKPFMSLSDAVITEKNLGEKFQIDGYNYRIKGEANRLIITGQGNYILEGVKSSQVGYPKSIGLPALRELFLRKLKKRLDNNEGKC